MPPFTPSSTLCKWPQWDDDTHGQLLTSPRVLAWAGVGGHTVYVQKPRCYLEWHPVCASDLGSSWKGQELLFPLRKGLEIWVPTCLLVCILHSWRMHTVAGRLLPQPERGEGAHFPLSWAVTGVNRAPNCQHIFCKHIINTTLISLQIICTCKGHPRY